MRPLSQHELLAVWEAGLNLAPAERALEMVRAGGIADDPKRLTPGQRDAALLEMRQSLFGQDICAVAACPTCGAEQEFEMRVEDLRTSGRGQTAFEAGEELSLMHGDYAVAFRVPEAADLVEVCAEYSDEARMREALLERCIVRARLAERDIAPAELDAEVKAAISQRMGEADPQGEVELSIQCAACRYEWLELFDVVSFFWREIQSWALRTLNDVHTLAAAYGWSENEALAVSPHRRAVYLDLIGSAY